MITAHAQMADVLLSQWLFIPKQKSGEENCRKIYNYQKLIRHKINPSLGASSDLCFFYKVKSRTGEDQIEGSLVEERLVTGHFLNLCKIH